METAPSNVGAAPTPAITANSSDAWAPLPSSRWDEDAARHLLRRATWSAQPDAVAQAVKDGLPATLERLFPAKAKPFTKPKLIENLQEDTPEFAQRIRSASPEHKRVLRKEARDRSQQAFADMALKWLQFAAEPEQAAVEKWVLFLSDVYVVSFEKVKNAAQIYDHFDIIRATCLAPAPILTKAISRSPAMVHYLDLEESKRDAPNENFARELFELFLLGEGNYTESDIKQAARAFTGYRQQFGRFRFARNQHDVGQKTVFGHTGNFDGDQVIDLAYKVPAASVFLPRELARFYLSDDKLPVELFEPLGAWWKQNHFNLRALAHRFFGSQLFFDAAYRNNYIKSPVQFYLGLVQDLQLDVAPIARRVLGGLRQMGQTLFTPPNVRGWVGGRNWINSATLSARRQLVQGLFYPINEANLNADELAAITAAKTNGHTHFTVETKQIDSIAGTGTPSATQLIRTFIPGKPQPEFQSQLQTFLDAGAPGHRENKIRNALIALLQAPEYQLC